MKVASLPVTSGEQNVWGGIIYCVIEESFKTPLHYRRVSKQSFMLDY
jgi:hypothetical protein